MTERCDGDCEMGGKHSAFKGDHGWECEVCAVVLGNPCTDGLSGHVPAQRLICVSCDEDLIKCDYCSTVALLAGIIPEGWIRCRFKTAEGLMLGPTTCPDHAGLMRKIFK